MDAQGLINLEKVKRVFTLYSEGGAVSPLILQVGIKFSEFYRILRENPSLQQEYYEIQRSRADMMTDEVYLDSMDAEQKDARLLRARAELKLRVAGFYDRKRFGDKVQVEIDTGPDLTAALLAARQRSALPARDLASGELIQDAAYKVIEGPSVTDMQSVSRESQAEQATSPDPFAD